MEARAVSCKVLPVAGLPTTSRLIGPARKAWQLADTGWYGAAPVLRRRIQPDRCKALVGVGVIAAGQRDLAWARSMLAEIDSACRQKSPNILS